MIDALYITAEDSIRTKAAGAQVYEGTPVALDSNGELVVANSSSLVYGLSKLDSNVHRDFAFGEFGAFGTGKLTVVTKGICRVKDTTFNEIEIDTATGPSGHGTTVPQLAAVTFAVNDSVFADDNGLITNVQGAGPALGKVVATPAMADGWLEIMVDVAMAGARGATGPTGATA